MLSQAIVEFGKPLQAIEAATPEPKGTEVLLQVEHAGVCHSDVHIHDGYFDLGGGNRLPLATLKLPHTLGHEIQGKVVAVGPDAKDVKPGARYAAFPWIGCGDCAACARNEENLCLKPRQLGCSSNVPGGYASHVLVPHPKYLLDFGSAEPALAAAYMCSGLTAFGAMKKVGKVTANDPVVVLGCGGVGMMGVQFAKALFGRGPIAADIDTGRLEAAKKAGAIAAYNTRDDGVAKRFVAETGGAYAVVDFVGSEQSFAFANAIVRKGGRIIIVGLFGGAMTMPLPLFPMRALTIAGSFVGSLPEAREMMDLVRAGKVDPIPYQTRPLAEASKTLDDLRAGKIIGRVILTP
ncbi:MAG: alcohol dehydrogenase catalytic domain-containing protein [Alphaproteobacteria bacterium]|nr:alcohol dehydrogenase catalytic domain-containing protein [Alphaproteobacteria bacterium]